MKHLNKLSLLLVLIFSALMYTGAHSQVFFEKDSWDVTCDNNTICRAAGYQTDDDNRPTSVLLEVVQGAGVPVVGYLNLSTPEDEVPSEPPVMFIGDKSYGHVALKANESDLAYGRIKQSSPFLLTPSQVDGLIGSAHRTEYVVFKSSDHQWDLPTAGLSAVLLKIDDLQKRLGTTSALSKRGKGKNTYQASRKEIETIDLVTLNENGLRLQNSELEGLQHYFEGSDCERFNGIGDISQTPLSATTAYLQAPCWLAAYNAGGTALLVRKTGNGELRVSEAPDGEFENGKITSSMKIRGLGDCWTIDEWIWNGEDLIRSLSLDTGRCKGFAGGAWSIPSIHYHVKTREHNSSLSPTPYPTGAKKLQTPINEEESKKRFMVEAGSFYDAKQARDARLRLENAGIKTLVNIATIAGKRVIRVRTGPFTNIHETRTYVDRINSLGLNARVLIILDTIKDDLLY